MTHIKKYWLPYTLITIGIVWLIIWGLKRPPCNTGATGLRTCPTNFELLFSGSQSQRQMSEPIKSGNYPKPVNGRCPKWYVFNQPQCITTPCDGECVPLANIFS